MEVELIDITETEQEEADCEQVCRIPLAQGGANVQTKEQPTQYTTPCATTTETTTETTETTVQAPVGAMPSPLKPWGIAPSKMELIQLDKSCFIAHKRHGPLAVAMLDESLIVEQQVLILHEAVWHRNMKMISASAGLFDKVF